MSSSTIDPHSRIAELEAKIKSLEATRNKLEQQLDEPGISDAKCCAIVQRMGMTIRIIGSAEQEVSKLRSVPPLDNRTFRELCDDALAHYVATLSDPLVLEFTVVTATVCMWFMVRNYMFMRLHLGAYKDPAQRHWRNLVFGLNFSHVPGAVRLGAGAALVAVLRSWSLTPQPKQSH